MSSPVSEAPLASGFPSLETILPAFDSGRQIRLDVENNLEHWRTIHGSLDLARKYRLDFNPREEYWYKTERRVLAAYFVKRFEFCYRPAVAMRGLTGKVFAHFDRVRDDGRFGVVGLAPKHVLGWRGLFEVVEAAARELPRFHEYDELRRARPRLKADSISSDLLAFLDTVRESELPDTFEPVFFRRLRWVPYLGLEALRDLPSRQMFFASFYGLFASTNAYKVGGALAFAPVLQNNEASELVAYAERWASGETPAQTGFDVEGKSDRRDRSHLAPVVELYGFLNLARHPFHNSAVPEYNAFAQPDDPSVIERTQRIGERTRTFLAGQPRMVDDLSNRLLDMISAKPLPAPIWMENEYDIEDPATLAASDDISSRLSAEMGAGALDKVRSLSPEQRASTLFHLMLDAVIYRLHVSPPADVSSPIAISEIVRDAPKAVPKVAPQSGRFIDLPPSLLPLGNDALAYLKSGFHVLFAGAPGTGKTTLAQFVGHAWNCDSTQVPQRIALSEAPITTVASSAWAPFHTIGGILPDKDGRFRVQRGIFMGAQDGAEGVWQLRPESIVLDEMNRADLDRCIGELYPLLTHSVESVEPAGVPGVRRICDHPRFRLIATVNDATIDDIVFPISEGLARRFVRLELRGATETEVKQFLHSYMVEGGNDRYAATVSLVGQFFALCREESRLQETELGEHLGFGVGYFGLLASWVAGGLQMSATFVDRELREQATDILRTSLRSATRDRGYERVFQRLDAPSA